MDIFGYYVGIKPNKCAQKKQRLNSSISIKLVYVPWSNIMGALDHGYHGLLSGT